MISLELSLHNTKVDFIRCAVWTPDWVLHFWELWSVCTPWRKEWEMVCMGLVRARTMFWRRTHCCQAPHCCWVQGIHQEDSVLQRSVEKVSAWTSWRSFISLDRHLTAVGSSGSTFPHCEFFCFVYIAVWPEGDVFFLSIWLLCFWYSGLTFKYSCYIRRKSGREEKRKKKSQKWLLFR